MHLGTYHAHETDIMCGKDGNLLQDVRVVQRRLVYAVGLAADICSDQVR